MKKSIFVVILINIGFILFVFIALIMNIIGLFSLSQFELGDLWIYQKAIIRYNNHENFYTEYFGYFPGFFFLQFFMYNIFIYFIFLLCSATCTFILMEKITKNVPFSLTIYLIELITITSGNIDVFIFPVILLCFYKKNDILNAGLLAFISFKPTLILILPIFLYQSKSRIKFLSFFSISWILFNSYFLIHPEYIGYFIDYTFSFFGNRMDYLRPLWVWFSYLYFCNNNIQYFKLEKNSYIFLR